MRFDNYDSPNTMIIIVAYLYKIHSCDVSSIILTCFIPLISKGLNPFFLIIWVSRFVVLLDSCFYPVLLDDATLNIIFQIIISVYNTCSTIKIVPTLHWVFSILSMLNVSSILLTKKYSPYKMVWRTLITSCFKEFAIIDSLTLYQLWFIVYCSLYSM